MLIFGGGKGWMLHILNLEIKWKLSLASVLQGLFWGLNSENHLSTAPSLPKLYKEVPGIEDTNLEEVSDYEGHFWWHFVGFLLKKQSYPAIPSKPGQGKREMQMTVWMGGQVKEIKDSSPWVSWFHRNGSYICL